MNASIAISSVTVVVIDTVVKATVIAGVTVSVIVGIADAVIIDVVIHNRNATVVVRCITVLTVSLSSTAELSVELA